MSCASGISHPSCPVGELWMFQINGFQFSHVYICMDWSDLVPPSTGTWKRLIAWAITTYILPQPSDFVLGVCPGHVGRSCIQAHAFKNVKVGQVYMYFAWSATWSAPLTSFPSCSGESWQKIKGQISTLSMIWYADASPIASAGATAPLEAIGEASLYHIYYLRFKSHFCSIPHTCAVSLFSLAFTQKENLVDILYF